jgi:hypothetical protein
MMADNAVHDAEADLIPRTVDDAVKEPRSDFVPSLLAIAAVAALCAFVLFIPGEDLVIGGLLIPVTNTSLRVGVLGTSNGAGVLALFGSPALTVLAALLLAERKRLCCGAGGEKEEAPAPPSNPVPAAVKPEVFNSADDPAYSERCKTAAADLKSVIERVHQPHEPQRKQLERRLKKHGLRWLGREGEELDVGAGAGSSTCSMRRRRRSEEVDEEEHTELDAAAKALRSLVMRFPEVSDVVLAANRFGWAKGGAPLRARPSEMVRTPDGLVSAPIGLAKLDAALATWTDKTTSAADSALFSSLGVWVSPFTVPLAALAGLYLAVGLLPNRERPKAQTFPLTYAMRVSNTLACFTTAVALRTGRRKLAQQCVALFFSLSALLTVLEGASAACKCWGPYARTHAATGNDIYNQVRNYPPEYVASKLVCCLPLASLAALKTYPHRSFGLLFVVFPTLYIVAVLPFSANYAQFYARFTTALLANVMLGIGAFLWRRRTHALEHAKKLDKKDMERYVKLWKTLLGGRSEDGFRGALRELREVWGVVQAGAAHSDAVAKGKCRRCNPSQTLDAWPQRPTRNETCECGVPRQQSDKKRDSGLRVGALFREADALNDLLHVKLYELCTKHGGTFLRSDVKAESRALQKVFRTYDEHWWRLSDLCRSSLVFDTIPQMSKCLRAIGDDPELVVVPSNDAKMRLREDFDAANLTGGYRDVQLTVLLDTEKTRARKCDRHLAEVQLHLASILELKSGAGHKNYVLRRNLRGN